MVDEFLRSLIRSKVHSFYSKKEHPTVDKVFALCKEEIQDFPDMGRTTFWKILRSIGFRYVKTEGNTKLMMERNEIVAWRGRYLRQIRSAREAGKPIVYLDETWVNAHHTVSRKWYDRGQALGAQQPSEAPSGKGQRLIILHAGSKDGFLQNCELVFVGNTKSHDYHDEMNAKHFTEWWTEKLLPNQPPGAVIVMDNAPYHTVKTDASRCPTSSSRKAELQEWLTKNDIPWTAQMRKPELLDLVRANKPAPVYVCDELAAAQNFQVVRLPPYHCIFNPIEMVWGWVKQEVAKRNKTFKINDVKAHVLDVFRDVPPQLWPNSCRHCDDKVDETWTADGLQEDMLEPIIIHLGNDSSDEEASDIEDTADNE